jgi:hypothetical protein
MRKFVTLSLAALFLASFGMFAQASADCSGHLKSAQPIPQTVVDGSASISKSSSGG